MNISNIKVGSEKCQSPLATSVTVSPILAELRHADHIIGAMLNVMTLRQKAKVHEQLSKAGVSGEGMTRANERGAVIEAATAAASPAAATPIHLTEDEKQLVTSYRAMRNGGQSIVLGVVESMARDLPRHKRPALNLVRGGVA